MKIHKLNPGIMIIILGVTIFLGTLFLSRARDLVYENFTLRMTLFGSIISLLALLGLCAISARIILWAYSRIQAPQYPRRIFTYGFLISTWSVLLRMWVGFQQYQSLRTVIPDLPLSPGYINFLAAGFEPVLFACAIITVALLWIARWRERKDEVSDSGGKETWWDIVLAGSTLVIVVLFIRSMLKIVMMTLSILNLGRG